MSQQSLRVQWIQLLVLSGVHFLVDMLGNLLPAILPVILKEYGITLFVGVSIPIFLSLAANGVQILTGRMRSDKTTPLFLHLGMILAASMCLIAPCPGRRQGFFSCSRSASSAAQGWPSLTRRVCGRCTLWIGSRRR